MTWSEKYNVFFTTQFLRLVWNMISIFLIQTDITINHFLILGREVISHYERGFQITTFWRDNAEKILHHSHTEDVGFSPRLRILKSLLMIQGAELCYFLPWKLFSGELLPLVPRFFETALTPVHFWLIPWWPKKYCYPSPQLFKFYR